jgi:hypothetical protein
MLFLNIYFAFKFIALDFLIDIDKDQLYILEIYTLLLLLAIWQ